MNGALRIFADLDAAIRAMAEEFVQACQQAIAVKDRCAIALSGGSTPKALYELLATEAYADRIDWGKLEVFWGDERCVPPDHPESNYRMTKTTLLDQVSLRPKSIHRIHGEIEAVEAAYRYEDEMRQCFAMPRESTPTSLFPTFDLILLGMGVDGHTASIFPGGRAMMETTRWAIADYVDKLASWRITMTLPVINAATRVVFLVGGADKAAILERILSAPRGSMTLPAGMIQPHRGRLIWMLDELAAGKLSSRHA